MIRAIKIELIKAFDNIYFRLVMLFEIVLTFYDYFKSPAWKIVNLIMGSLAGDELCIYELEKGKEAENVLMFWAPNTLDDIFTYNMMILPILAAIPYGLSYYLEKKNGLINQYIIKTNKRNYYISKLVAAFVSGGTLSIIFPFINLILCMCSMPYGVPMVSTGRYGVSTIKVFSNVFYTYPTIYIFIYFIYTFIIFGLINTICLSGVYILDNAFSVSIAPFVYYYGTYAVTRGIEGHSGKSLYRFARMQFLPTRYVPYLLIQIGIIILGIVLYMIRARKDVL